MPKPDAEAKALDKAENAAEEKADNDAKSTISGKGYDEVPKVVGQREPTN